MHSCCSLLSSPWSPRNPLLAQAVILSLHKACKKTTYGGLGVAQTNPKYLRTSEQQLPKLEDH